MSLVETDTPQSKPDQGVGYEPAETVDTSRIFTYRHQSGETHSGNVVDMQQTCSAMGNLSLKHAFLMAEAMEMGQLLLEEQQEETEDTDTAEDEAADEEPNAKKTEGGKAEKTNEAPLKTNHDKQQSARPSKEDGRHAEGVAAADLAVEIPPPLSPTPEKVVKVPPIADKKFNPGLAKSAEAFPVLTPEPTRPAPAEEPAITIPFKASEPSRESKRIPSPAGEELPTAEVKPEAANNAIPLEAAELVEAETAEEPAPDTAVFISREELKVDEAPTEQMEPGTVDEYPDIAFELPLVVAGTEGVGSELSIEELESPAEAQIVIEQAFQAQAETVELDGLTGFYRQQAVTEERLELYAPKSGIPLEEIEAITENIAAKVESLNPDKSEPVHWILDRIMEVPAELERTEGKDLNSGEAVAEELAYLYTTLFEELEMNYHPELIGAFVAVTLDKRLPALDTVEPVKPSVEELSRLYGTHEFINGIRCNITPLKQAATQAYLVGKSALKLYSYQYTAA